MNSLFIPHQETKFAVHNVQYYVRKNIVTITKKVACLLILTCGILFPLEASSLDNNNQTSKSRIASNLNFQTTRMLPSRNEAFFIPVGCCNVLKMLAECENDQDMLPQRSTRTARSIPQKLEFTSEKDIYLSKKIISEFGNNRILNTPPLKTKKLVFKVSNKFFTTQEIRNKEILVYYLTMKKEPDDIVELTQINKRNVIIVKHKKKQFLPDNKGTDY